MTENLKQIMFQNEMAVAVCICFLIFIGKETLGLPSATEKLNIHMYNVKTRSY